MEEVNSRDIRLNKVVKLYIVQTKGVSPKGENAPLKPLILLSKPFSARRFSANRLLHPTSH